MNELKQFAGKRMPYKENDDYVARLIAKSADVAIVQAKQSQKARFKTVLVRWCSVAAMIAIIVGTYWWNVQESDFEQYKNSESLADVLDSMSDEQVMNLYCYELEEIPEYYE
ncbi:MAG: hypothetical protein E7080_06690 [Bacteroidales bacterium]|nr:hypothetical protein [Bacteroidales bacterium]